MFDDLIFEKFEKNEKRGSFQNGTIPVYQRLTTPFFLAKVTVGATNAFEKSNLAGFRHFSVSLVFQRLTHLNNLPRYYEQTEFSARSASV